ncbi:MAG: VanZ family protein [Mangrovibacterium sp.]
MIIEKIAAIANKHLTLLKVLTFVWLFLITLLCIIPQEELPDAGGIPNFDKFVHFVLYFVMAVLSLFVFSGYKPSHKIIIVTLIFIFSFFIEVMQGIMPFGRTFSFTDLLANLSGILTGLLLFQKKLKHLPSQR